MSCTCRDIHHEKVSNVGNRQKPSKTYRTFILIWGWFGWLKHVETIPDGDHPGMVR
jgi:hypothetical protein